MTEGLDIFILGFTLVNIAIGVYNSILAYQRTKYARGTLEGSVSYWGSWKERKKDITKEVLKEITTEILVKELTRRKENEERRMDSKKTKTS
jgi:hypothetical protein